jgi:Na+(H+)/acetate symporter ActP
LRDLERAIMSLPDGKTARRSVVWVMFLAGAFFACTTIFGLAAAHFVGQDAIRAADRGGNLTLPLLAQYLGGGKGSAGGEIMLGFVAAVAVATIIAVVAGLTLATSGAIAHDLYINLIKKGNRIARPNTNSGGQTISIASPSHAAVTGSIHETGYSCAAR